MVRTLALLASLVLILPAVVSAQDGGPPQVLSISSWQCPQSAIGDIAEDYDMNTRPIEDELVSEGLMISAGLYFHAWADEWNVNYYRIAPSMEGLFSAIAEVGRRFGERHPDLVDESPFDVCTAHKDNIYFVGPSTGDSEGN